MDPELNRLNQELEELRRRIAQLKKENRGPEPFWNDRQPVRKPLEVARGILFVFLIVGGWAMIVYGFKFSLGHSRSVLVARENGVLQVWPDPRTFEADTGKSWIGLPSQDVEFPAVFHDSGFPVQSIYDFFLPGFVFLMLTGFALRSVNRARARLLVLSETEPKCARGDPPAS